MIAYFRAKDKKVRTIFKKIELLRRRSQFLLRNASLSAGAKQKLIFSYVKGLGKHLPSSTRIRNRCLITQRAGSVFRYFRLSRITLKELASRGSLAGVRKSS